MAVSMLVGSIVGYVYTGSATGTMWGAAIATVGFAWLALTHNRRV